MQSKSESPSQAENGSADHGNRVPAETAVGTLISQLRLEASRVWQENGRILDLGILRLRVSAGRALLSLALAGLFWSALLSLTLLATLQLLRAVEIAVGGAFGPAYGLLASAGAGLGMVAGGVGLAARKGQCRARAALADTAAPWPEADGLPGGASRAAAPEGESGHVVR
jgi:hypothetical protein